MKKENNEGTEVDIYISYHTVITVVLLIVLAAVIIKFLQ